LIATLVCCAGAPWASGCASGLTNKDAKEAEERQVAAGRQTSRTDAELRDLHLREPDTPVVALRVTRDDAEMDFIAAPGLAPDWVAVSLRQRRTPLRRCAALSANLNNGFVTTPIEAFDRFATSSRSRVSCG
jgi:hypothetical protein